MATVQQVEDLEVWRKARKYSQEVWTLVNEGTFQRDFELKNQIIRSSGSVMDNIAEGFERGGNPEFIHFLIIAKGSAGELRSQLYRAMDRTHLTVEQFELMNGTIVEISRMIGGLIGYLKQSEIKGQRYKK